MVEVERRVEVIPTEDFERRQVGLLSILGEVSQTDPALLAFTVVGNEKQIVSLPSGTFCTVSRGPLLHHHPAEYPPQCNNGEPFRFELNEKNAPGLVRRKWTKALDLLNLGGIRDVDAKFLRRVVKCLFFEVLGAHGPVQLISEELDQRRECPYSP